MGSDADGYVRHLQYGNVWVLEDQDGSIAGFATTLGATAFRASPMFARRDAIVWRADVSSELARPIAYFDQLAVRSGVSSRAAAHLAFVALWDVLATDAEHVVATTVVEPIRNLASIPFIRRIGGSAVGHIAETYPEIGNLVSTVWLLRRSDVGQRLREGTALGRFLAASVLTLGSQPVSETSHPVS